MQMQVLQSGQPVIQPRSRVGPRSQLTRKGIAISVACQFSSDDGRMGSGSPAVDRPRASTPPVASIDSEIHKQALGTAEALVTSSLSDDIRSINGRPLPRVLILHTGGTLGMDPEESFELEHAHLVRPRPGHHGTYYEAQGPRGLRPAAMLANVLGVVPELRRFSQVELSVVSNNDSSRMGPRDWIHLASILDESRSSYDAFMVIHGTDTLAYTASALSLMLRGFGKPIVLTGSQLPLIAPRTDARQNLLDSIQVATSAFVPPHVSLQEVAVCFGGRLLRGNRSQKVHSSSYQAFDSRGYPPLAQLGIDVEWNTRYMLRPEGLYRPRLKLDPAVIRVPVVPGCDPRVAYGDLVGRGVKGIVLEAFGVGTLPDLEEFGWLPWLQQQTAAGLQVVVVSQCSAGPLQPDLYASGGMLSSLKGVQAAPNMTVECAVVKLMLCLAYPDLGVGEPLAGEL